VGLATLLALKTLTDMATNPLATDLLLVVLVWAVSTIIRAQ
jgi:hypothetical protein